MTSDRRASSRRQAGFTLAEILVAVVVTAVLMAMATTSLRMLAGASEQGARQADRVEMLTRGYAALRRDLQRIERGVTVGRDKEVRYLFEGGPAAMSFLVVDPSFPTGSGTYVVTYTVAGSGGRAELLRGRTAYTEGSRTPARQADDERIAVIEGPYRIRLAYFDRGGGRERWVERWTDKLRLPAMIKIEVTQATAGQAAPPALIVRPRIDGEATCLYGQGSPCSLRTGRLTVGQGAGQQRWEATPK
ncbi:MAG: prepilin-type N-terminal cleavage/methylation domain-containing protein [Hyphomicrobiaceae bacterium]|nr:prepilin-type N-terminal cleavage/methylation domain-containing protein [Hyphomicrobiaceae bacterium]